MDQTICEIDQIKRAAGYIRVSTAEQVQKKLSIETQIAEIESYAKLHNMRLEGIYIDRGITARKSLEKRFDFMRMMKDVQSGKINHIIVLRLDRFFRNVYDYHRMMNEYLEPNKCDWSAVKESYTTSTTNGRLMINLRLSIAEQECDTDSDRIRDVLDHRARQGFAISGAQPYGLKIVDHRVVPDEEKIALVQDMFNRMETHNSVRDAMSYVNEKYDEKFAYGTIRRMLSNPLYCGRHRDNENYCVPIITVEQFVNVQRLLPINTRMRSTNNTYAFSGLLVCDHCNTKLAANTTRVKGRTYINFRCNKASMSKLCENRLSISIKTIETYLFENLDRLLEDHIMEAESKSKEAKGRKNNRKSIEAKLQRLNELYLNGFIDMEKYKADYSKLQAQIIETTTQELPKDLSVFKKFLKSEYKETYTTLSTVEKQTMWRSIIKEIRVSGKEITDIKFL